MRLYQPPVNSDVAAPFAGCSRLLDHYRQSGRALLDYERKTVGTLVPTARHLDLFSQGVAFVPVEVLESYLDDLLDLGVSDEGLFIKRPKPSVKTLSLGGLTLVLLGVVLNAEFADQTLWQFPVMLCLMFLAGLGSAFYFLPRAKVVRRFRFATVVSREIARRRGHDKTEVGNYTTQFLLRELWAKPGASASSSVSVHPARAITRYYH